MMIIGDCLEVLKAMPTQQLHSTVTSPPYWGKLFYGTEGEHGNEKSSVQYFQTLGETFKEVYRHTLPGGSLLINIGETWNNLSPIRERLGQTKGAVPIIQRRKMQPGYAEKEAIGLMPWLLLTLTNAGWIHRDTWIWVKSRVSKDGLYLPPKGRPTGSDRPPSDHEYILYLRKPDGKKRYTEAYWDGYQVPSSVFHIAPVSDPAHPCPMPEELAKRLVLATVPLGGTVLDPYAGIGTVPKVANTNGRLAIGIDLKAWGCRNSQNHVDVAR